MRPPLIPLLLAALLLPCVAAEPGLAYEAEAIGSLGASSLEGDGRLLLHAAGAGHSPTVSLTAESIVVETVERTQDVSVGEVSHDPDPPARDQHPHGAGRVELGLRGPDGDLFLDAAARRGFAVDASEWRAFDPAEDFYAPPTFFTAGPAPSFGLDGLHEVSVAAWPWTLSVEGDLAITLWDWNFTVTDASGSHAYWTGAQSKPLAPADGPGGEPLAEEVTQRKATLHAKGAVLTVSWASGEGCRLWAPLSTVEVAGALRLENAQDLLGGGRQASVLAGPGAFALGPPEDGAFRVDAIPGDEGPPRPAAGTALAGAFPVPWWLPAAFGLALLGLAAWLRHRRQRGFGSGAPDEALALRTMADLREGRLEEAEATLMDPDAPLDPAAHRFLLACLYALQGRRADAKRELQRCLGLDPGYEQEARANPWTGPLLSLDTEGYA